MRLEPEIRFASKVTFAGKLHFRHLERGSSTSTTNNIRSLFLPFYYKFRNTDSGLRVNEMDSKSGRWVLRERCDENDNWSEMNVWWPMVKKLCGQLMRACIQSGRRDFIPQQTSIPIILTNEWHRMTMTMTTYDMQKTLGNHEWNKRQATRILFPFLCLSTFTQPHQGRVSSPLPIRLAYSE